MNRLVRWVMIPICGTYMAVAPFLHWWPIVIAFVGCAGWIATWMMTTAWLRLLQRGRFPLVPPDMACPFCGGYVRGHQWIGLEDCSIVKVFPE